MAKNNELNFTFIDPNTREEFEKLLKQIITDKLRALHPDNSRQHCREFTSNK